MTFDYQALIDEAMLGVVKNILTQVRNEGLKGDQSFYVSFLTNYGGVVLSKPVKNKHPQEITIVLQHQFKNLTILEDKFIVNISFEGRPEDVVVPFQSITSFLDPISNFGFRFVTRKALAKPKIKPIKIGTKAAILSSESKFIKNSSSKITTEGNIVAFDKFRKKRNEEVNI